jgi:phenylalanyl-tRNA synthetase beta subunit
MIISYNWLKEYFKKLPKPEKLENLITKRSFEVEDLEKVDNDYVFNIDVLPNRTHDSLCHYGIAKEISTITGLKFIDKLSKIEKVSTGKKSPINVNISGNFCKRYIARQIDDIEIKDSPKEIKDKLKSLGQKSINNIVDITNIVMFEMGQPMHAFDTQKLSGDTIFVRSATEGEQITTLDKQEIKLSAKDYVIADKTSALAIAGIKGGKKAEVDKNTTSIILEAANFNPTDVRKTAKRINIGTESSRRFENEITPAIAGEAVDLATDLILKYASTNNTVVYDSIDVYPRQANVYKTGVSAADVTALLGLKLSERQIKKTLQSLDFPFEIVDVRKKIIEEANKYLGCPYELHASVRYDAPRVFDCSSFTAFIFAQAGLTIPRISIDQFVFGREIKRSELQPGDLVFGNNEIGHVWDKTVEFLPGTKVEGGIDHVGIYIGDNKVIHCSRYNKTGVEISDIDNCSSFKKITKCADLVESEKRFVINVPVRRLDITNKTELVEEIGRIYGYESVKDLEIPKNSFKPKIQKTYAYNNLIRKTLADLGFSEVITYTFVKEGDISPEKPIADDKAFLRTNLLTGMIDALDKNLKNIDLFGLDQVKLFEIGKVFPKDGEKLFLSLGVVNKNGFKKPKPTDSLRQAVEALSVALNKKISVNISDNDNSVEINLDKFYESLSAPTELFNLPEIESITYKPISTFPFILRDIAVWLPNNVDCTKLLKVINKHSGSLLVKTRLFDVYKKDDKTSYAYRLVFQSNEKTLTDVEINKIMEAINADIAEKGWEVR